MGSNISLGKGETKVVLNSVRESCHIVNTEVSVRRIQI